MLRRCLSLIFLVAGVRSVFHEVAERLLHTYSSASIQHSRGPRFDHSLNQWCTLSSSLVGALELISAVCQFDLSACGHMGKQSLGSWILTLSGPQPDFSSYAAGHYKTKTRILRLG